MTNFVPGWWYSTSGIYQLSNHASNSVKVFLHSFAGVKEEETNLFVHRAAMKGRHASRDASLFTFIYRSHLLTDIFTYSLFNGDLVLKIGKVSNLLWSRFLRDKTSNIKKNRSATFLLQLNNEKKLIWCKCMFQQMDFILTFRKDLWGHQRLHLVRE